MRSPSRSTSRSPSPPDLVEPIVGWRVWRVDRRHRLCSALRDEAWQPHRAFAAGCSSDHAAPDPRCTCGIYAVRRPQDARLYLVGRNSPEAVHRVLGRVALWGRVVEYERGWRAERAYPSRLWVPECPVGFQVAAALGRYGVPVELIEASGAAEVVELVEPTRLPRERLPLRPRRALPPPGGGAA
jgi:hypothetical protein